MNDSQPAGEWTMQRIVDFLGWGDYINPTDVPSEQRIKDLQRLADAINTELDHTYRDLWHGQQSTTSEHLEAILKLRQQLAIKGEPTSDWTIWLGTQLSARLPDGSRVEFRSTEDREKAISTHNAATRRQG